MQKLFSDVYLLAYSMGKEGMQCVRQGFKKKNSSFLKVCLWPDSGNEEEDK